MTYCSVLEKKSKTARKGVVCWVLPQSSSLFFFLLFFLFFFFFFFFFGGVGGGVGGGGNVSVKLASRWMSMLMAVDSTDKKRMQQTNHDQNIQKIIRKTPFFDKSAMTRSFKHKQSNQ